MRQTKGSREQRNWRRARRRARARVVQALYAWDAVRDRAAFDDVATRLWDDLALGIDERDVVAPLQRLVTQHLSDADRLIAEHAHNWRPERIGAIERAVLRLGAAELLAPADAAREATPPRVIIQEMVVLAERFGSDASARFVNGVLDALGRHLGRL
ncbi:MAG: transcription antitermination factor NusB [Gemmatimonadaceae bacterium]|nr:transcription antitermination factor NusB [Gemmatimonadaceae bacterium]